LDGWAGLSGHYRRLKGVLLGVLVRRVGRLSTTVRLRIGRSKRLKSPCTLHLSMSTVMLSGLGVQGVESLGFQRVFLGTAKPDTAKNTGHFIPA